MPGCLISKNKNGRRFDSAAHFGSILALALLLFMGCGKKSEEQTISPTEPKKITAISKHPITAMGNGQQGIQEPLHSDDQPPELRAAKEAYFDARGWEEGNPAFHRGDSTNAYFQFYVDCLDSKEPKIRRVAFDFFNVVCGNPIAGPISSDILADAEKSAVYAVFSTAYAVSQSDFGVLGNQPQWLLLVERIKPFLYDPESQHQAVSILNFVTANLYADRSLDWWTKEFSTSQFAGLLEGLPFEEWSTRSDGALVPPKGPSEQYADGE